ncbi:UNVERIFIED_CONTAM: hypothetical protein Slati_2928900 [Sesamum latifolium]|uniref:Uncharacterized protein n=1 Tax=Sesamum latifolium TaxID=2727402 RepID=A0AAW2VIJ4_9LAMI
MQYLGWRGVHDTPSSNALWQFMHASHVTLDWRTIFSFPLPSLSEAIGALKALAAADSASSFFLIQPPASLPFTFLRLKPPNPIPMAQIPQSLPCIGPTPSIHEWSLRDHLEFMINGSKEG